MPAPKGNHNRARNWVGEQFGDLTVIAELGFRPSVNHEHGYRILECRCVCGRIIQRGANNIKKRATSSCGCQRFAIKEYFAPTEHPALLDIAWAAGIWEGEGSFKFGARAQRGQVQVTQKDTWILYRLKALFGGNVKSRKGSAEWRTINDWILSGPRAHGFLMTIWKFLSPRRKEQIFATRNFRFKGRVSHVDQPNITTTPSPEVLAPVEQ